jgi:hypothetical protein
VLVDADGVQQAVLRGNRAGAHTLDSAFAKAYTSVSFKTDTTALVERSNTVPVLANLFKLPHLLLLGGGIAIKVGDEVGWSDWRRRGAGRRSRRRLRPRRPGQDQGPAEVAPRRLSERGNDKDDRMRVGISLTSNHPDVKDPRQGARWMIECAAAGRRAALGSLFVGDQHVSPTPYYQNTPMLGRLLAERGKAAAGCLFLLPCGDWLGYDT